MATIEVDFDVFKELTVRRKTEATTYNEVIRSLLGLKVSLPRIRANGPGWVQKGINFPNGTEFRATYKGKTCVACIADSQMKLDGKSMNSLSDAARYITGHSVNGWRFWEYRFPGEDSWRLADSLKI